MTNFETDTAELHPAELMLPWYVNGKLSDAEKAEVEAWLKENPEAQAHLNRADEERIIAIESAEEIPMPRASAINDVLAAVGADVQRRATAPSLSERFFDLLTPRWAMAGAAAIALLVVAQGTTIGMLVNQQPISSFETASGPAEAISGVTALVAFQPEVSVADISAYLEQSDLTIVGGPKPGGIYQIAATDDDAGRAALDALSKEQTMVSFFAGQE